LILGCRFAVHLAVERAFASASIATRMFAETVGLTGLFGLLLWRFVIVPAQRRHAADHAPSASEPVAMARVEIRTPAAITRGHLRLVSSPSGD